jgi:hypothetical protein
LALSGATTKLPPTLSYARARYVLMETPTEAVPDDARAQLAELLGRIAPSSMSTTFSNKARESVE